MTLLGAASPLWRHAPLDAAILAASIPSGTFHVVQLRASLSHLSYGPCWDPCRGPPPSVVHSFPSVEALPPDHIYVGSSSPRHLSSPWLDPTCFPDIIYTSFADYAARRADLETWLLPLVGKTLVCSCCLGDGCHALVLRQLCVDELDNCIMTDASVTPGLSSASCGAGIFSSVGDFLENENFTPSRRVSRTTIGMRVAASSQPVRLVVPQLVPDGLTPREHLEAALKCVHPFQRDPTVHPPVGHALRASGTSSTHLDDVRLRVSNLMVKLAAALSEENFELLALLHPDVSAVLRSAGFTKNLAAMRELAFIYTPRDWGAVPYLATGLPMVGPSDAVGGMLARSVSQEYTVDEFAAGWEAQQATALSQVKPSHDGELDRRAYAKSQDERKRGVLVGPFRKLSELPVTKPCLIPRHGVWEQHGGSAEPTVRVIDNMLAGGQNGTAAYSTTHRPADGDAICAQQRAVQEAYPSSATAGWTSDFAKAFKQVPHLPFFKFLCVIAQWCPAEKCVHFWLALSQLFGGRLAPQNFARYPAWFTEILASALAIPVQHCSDDMLGMERFETVWSGWAAWRKLASTLGWDVPDAKSPEPSQCYLAVGYKLNHVGTPDKWARLQLSEQRHEALQKYIAIALKERRLTGAAAGSLYGRLGFALNSAQGRFGRALMRPIKRRQYELRSNLNTQLEAALLWWQKFLRKHVPRAIPVSLRHLKVVVSYSDGEGTGGVGVAVWHPDLPKPRAAYMIVPWLLRRLWALQSSKTFKGHDQRDIFEIEAVGPLIALDMWPELFRGVLWLHFIDNAAAQASLTRGSSSVESGDALVSLTWQRVVGLRCLPWFDRVASPSNPVDGLSRGDMEGDWSKVEEARVPRGLLPRIRDELEKRGVSVTG